MCRQCVYAKHQYKCLLFENWIFQTTIPAPTCNPAYTACSKSTNNHRFSQVPLQGLPRVMDWTSQKGPFSSFISTGGQNYRRNNISCFTASSVSCSTTFISCVLASCSKMAKQRQKMMLPVVTDAYLNSASDISIMMLPVVTDVYLSSASDISMCVHCH